MKKNFREITFKELVDSIIKESVEEIDGFETEVETEEPETDTDEFDVSDFEDTEEDIEKEEGDVTLTLTLEEITTLRSIMAKIDAATEDETEDEVESEDVDGEEIEIEEDVDTEDEADIPVPSEEEETVVVSRGETGVTLSNKGVSRKKETPAVNRAGAHKDGAMGTPRAAGNADAAELSNVGVSRKKGTPAVNRQGKHTATHIAPDKVVIEIGK